MEVVNIGASHSVASQFLLELRDKGIQQDRMRFRKNAERLGNIMAYEISRKLNYVAAEIQTPLKEHTQHILQQQPVLITIMRAGIPYFQGFQAFFDQSDSGFIGAYRQEGGAGISVKMDYLASPAIADKTVILIDPMLATGKSALDSITELLKQGAPRHLHIAALVAAPEGIDYLQKNIKASATLWTFAIDDKLNSQFYIVPGLGDAGDLSFGQKIG
jgi:uracil phosphoribosyltransferase